MYGEGITYVGKSPEWCVSSLGARRTAAPFDVNVEKATGYVYRVIVEDAKILKK